MKFRLPRIEEIKSVHVAVRVGAKIEPQSSPDWKRVPLEFLERRQLMSLKLAPGAENSRVSKPKMFTTDLPLGETEGACQELQRV